MTAFHDTLFPLEIALGSRGGPQRNTDIVTLGSGREERNQRWFRSRRRYNAGYGIKSLDAIAQVTAFFEERRGKLYGFLWRDHADCKSCPPGHSPGPDDQVIGIGDGIGAEFQLRKRYGSQYAPYYRDICKPEPGSVRVTVDGLELSPTEFVCDYSTGIITLADPPVAEVAVSAGYIFNVPVRFDTDYLEIDLAAFEAGDVPNLPIVEIIL